MKKSYIQSAIASIALMLGAAGSANALTIQSGSYSISINAYDSGTVNYNTTTGNPGTVCSSVADCNNVAGIIKASGSVGSTNTSADTMGIFSVNSITDLSTGQDIFVRGGADGYLTGVFGNLTDYSVTIGALTTTANAIGGTVSLYQNATNYLPAQGAAPKVGLDLNNDLYPGITSGSLYLQGNFVSGVLTGDTKTTYQSIFSNIGFAGSGSGFIDLTGGSAFDLFNTNALKDNNGVMRDLSLSTNFDDVNGAAANLGFTVTSTGQLKANVPEPGSIALLGMGALVAGLATRRRKQAAK